MLRLKFKRIQKFKRQCARVALTRRQASDVAERPVSEIVAQRGLSTFDREKHWRAVMLNLSNLSKLIYRQSTYAR
jgi:hypothetical protein